MTPHPFRWTPLVFGLFFLAALGQWLVWEYELLRPEELGYTVAGVLIVLGVAGIVGVAVGGRRSGAARSTTHAAPGSAAAETTTTEVTAATEPVVGIPSDDEPATAIGEDPGTASTTETGPTETETSTREGHR